MEEVEWEERGVSGHEGFSCVNLKRNGGDMLCRFSSMSDVSEFPIEGKGKVKWLGRNTRPARRPVRMEVCASNQRIVWDDSSPYANAPYDLSISGYIPSKNAGGAREWEVIYDVVADGKETLEINVDNIHFIVSCEQRRKVMTEEMYKEPIKGIKLISRNCDNPVADLVLLHGIDGGAVATWQTRDETRSFWPSWVADDFQNVRVLSVNYDSNSTKWNGSDRAIQNVAVELLDALCNIEVGNRPTVFICHSLGGLILKQILRVATDSGNKRWVKLPESASAVMFFSTPHKGADLATWVDRLKVVSKATKAIEFLTKNHPVLLELDGWFRDGISKLSMSDIRVYCEEKTTFGVCVVDSGSADPGISSVRPVPLPYNHIDICKINTRNDARYVAVRSMLNGVVSDPG